MCSIETSESIKGIAEALCQFQGLTHGVVKDSRNPHFKNRYASLEAVIETVRTPMNECGLAFMQAPGRVVNGALEVSTMLMHYPTGQWIRSTMSIPLTKQDPQGVGSAITYGCRYALMASLGLPALDDDAEAARHQPPQEKPRPAPSVQEVSKQSRDVYVENSIDMISKFTNASELLEWAKTEKNKVWPQYGIDPFDTEGQRLVKTYKDRIAVLESKAAA